MPHFQSIEACFRPVIEKEIARALCFSLKDNRSCLEAAMSYSALAKSKRVRPLLSICSSLLFSPDPKKILPFSVAIELIHTYSLIHDDLPAMDNDDFRRGQAACHKRFGEDIAILAGDCLQTIAFELMSSELPRSFQDRSVLKAISFFSKECGLSGLIGGQILDITHTQNSDMTQLQSIHALKTAALIRSALIVPAILEEQNEDTQAHLSQFGVHLGLLFQIIDDLLDVVGIQRELGKTVRKDLDQNKLTYVTAYGIDQTKHLASEQATLAKHALSKLDTVDTSQLAAFADYFLSRSH